jgi:hypothetical protein
VHSLAQTGTVLAPPANTKAIVQVAADLAAHAFDRILPFDVPFFVTGRAPEGTVSLEVQYAVIPQSGDASALRWMPGEPARWQPDGPAKTDQPFLVLVRTPLEGGRVYRFRFVFRNGQSVDTAVTADGRTEQKNYVSVDAGLLYAGTIGIAALYLGSNIYFRPVNKDAPLTGIGSIGRRLALTVGLTVSSVADENNKTRSDLFWNQSLVLGAGFLYLAPGAVHASVPFAPEIVLPAVHYLCERYPEVAPHHAIMTKRVLHDRSVVMAYRMQRELRRGDAFVALGALHLYGPQGVLAHLEQDGYRAVRVF